MAQKCEALPASHLSHFGFEQGVGVDEVPLELLHMHEEAMGNVVPFSCFDGWCAVP